MSKVYLPNRFRIQLVREGRWSNPIIAKTPDDVVKILEPMRHEARETFAVLCLGIDLSVVASFQAFSGGVDQCAVNLPVMLRAVFLSGCDRFIVAHNHPSGNPIPSFTDLNLTRRIVKATRLIGLELMDHIVIASIDANPDGVYWRSIRESSPQIWDENENGTD